MKNKYYNDAVIGNKNIVASFSKKGEMLRLFYPSPDYRQFIDIMQTGVKVNDSALIYLHEDINNIYEQYYLENTNILNTKIKNTYFNLSILQTDFTSISKNLIIKKYKFTNENTIDLNVKFLVYSKLLSNVNNMVASKVEKDICMQYTHDYTYCIFSKAPIISYRLNNSFEEIKSGVIKDKDYIGMAEDTAISYDIGVLKPGEEKQIEIFIYINENKEKYKFDEIIEKVEKIKNIDVNKEQEEVKRYWESYVKEHDTLKILTSKVKWQNLITGKKEANEYTYEKYLEMKKAYTRSILLFPLLLNEETGGISAAVEVDENKEKSGRYSYCWPRDAVFICKALDILGMYEEVTKFYTKFCYNTQSKNGMWEQRFYTDGRLAPSWGYQIDETASIIYGVYEHYQIIKDKEFLKNTYQMCKKAIELLGTFLFSSSVPLGSSEQLKSYQYEIDIKKFKNYEGYDLWEMNEGVHLYSLAAIYSAYIAMAKIEEEFENSLEAEKYINFANKLREYVLYYFVNKDSNTLKRSNKDNICDISILGTVIPFNMLNIQDSKVKNTIEKMELNLKTYTGGYIRFENDSYMYGNNPWPIATLWMALYNIKIGKSDEALKQIKFVINTQTEHGFLAEQIDNGSMSAKWVIGLGWSHAMYIIALSQLLSH